MALDPITQLQNSTYQPAGASQQSLGSVDFMKLIIAQMRNQNPLDPQSDSDFMAQMAQFEALNQMKMVAEGVKVLQGVNELSTASGMIGRTVTGQTVPGVSVIRDLVSREKFGASWDRLASAQQQAIDADPRVQQSIADLQTAGMAITGKVDRVIVGRDGIPMLLVGTKVVDLFTVAEVR